MVTGSFVSSLQGTPRSTHDTDIVVALDETKVSALFQRFSDPRYYLSETAAREAIREQRMFNLTDTTTGDKVDFWILTTEPFDRSRFARRQHKSLYGVDVWISSPEDTILAKLLWSALCGGSRQQEADARSVYELQGDSLDREYLVLWVGNLGLSEPWNRMLTGAEPEDDQ
jgi:hypothetical protein